MAFLFPGRARPGMPGSRPWQTPAGAETWLLGSGGRAHATQERTRGVVAQSRIQAGLHAAEAGERRIGETPYHEFMPPGAERQAARARGEVGAKEGGRRAAHGVRRRAAASVGRTLLEGRGAGRISRFAVREKPQTEETAKKLGGYRERERKRKATARAGKKSVLRGRGRYGTRR